MILTESNLCTVVLLSEAEIEHVRKLLITDRASAISYKLYVTYSV